MQDMNVRSLFQIDVHIDWILHVDVIGEFCSMCWLKMKKYCNLWEFSLKIIMKMKRIEVSNSSRFFLSLL